MTGRQRTRRTREDRRAIGYCRVSTLGQVEHGVSLDVQSARIEAWCVVNGYILAEIKVDEGLSGGRADNRPALQQSMAVLRRGDALVVYSLSRLARSTRDTLLIADALERRGADLVSLSESIDTTTANGRMNFNLMAMLSQFERDVIAERTASAMWHLQRQGRYIGGHTPYGWVRGEGSQLVAVPVEQHVLGLVAEMRAEGKSLRDISGVLELRGLLNRVGQPFAPTQIHRLLTRNWDKAQPQPP